MPIPPCPHARLRGWYRSRDGEAGSVRVRRPRGSPRREGATPGHYMWSHEPGFYGWVEGSPPTLKPPASERTVWNIVARARWKAFSDEKAARG